MKHKPTLPIDKRADPEFREEFRWPGPVRDHPAHAWRKAVEFSIQSLLKDVQKHLDEPIVCFTNDRFSNILCLGHALTEQRHNPLSDEHLYKGDAAQWLYFWKESNADLNDRRYVVDFLGRVRARAEHHANIAEQSFRMSKAHTDHWLRKMTEQAWCGVPLPEWMPAETQEIISEKNDDDHSQESISYIPWIDKNDQGLHGDLVVFLTAFCKAFPTTRNSPFRYAIQLAKSCVLLRALAVVAPERVPATTVQLIGDAEERLDARVLKGEKVVNPEMYALVRAAWDRHVLADKNEREDDPNTEKRRIRTL